MKYPLALDALRGTRYRVRVPTISIYLKADAQKALTYLVEEWHGGQTDKRNAAIQRALLETAKREGMK